MRRRSLNDTALALLALAAFALRAVSLDAQPLWRDEVDALRFATVPRSELLSNFSRQGWNGPLYYLLLRGWVMLTGSSEYAMRFFSLVFGVLCVPLAYVLGRRLFGRRAGLLVALLLAASPYLTWYGQEVKMYTLVPALALVAIYGLRRAVDEGRRWWIVPLLATGLALYTHILAALFVPVLAVLALVWWRQARGSWVGVLLGLFLLTLLYLPLGDWQIPLLLRARETGFGRYSPGETARVLLDGWSMGVFGTFAWGWPWGTILTSVLALWGLCALVAFPLLEPPPLEGRVRGRVWRDAVALLAWMTVPPLAVWIVGHWQPLFTDRYFVWCAPAFYLLVAAGLGALWNVKRWGRWVVLLLMGITLGFNCTNLWQQATVTAKSDFRAAAAYVAQYEAADEEKGGTSAPLPGLPENDRRYPYRLYLPLLQASDPVVDGLIIFQIPHGRYTFDYYFPYDDYPWAEGMYTNHRWPDGSHMMSEQDVASTMRRLTAHYQAVWLVASEAGMWDERGVVQAWLDANTRRADERHYVWVDVYRYEK